VRDSLQLDAAIELKLAALEAISKFEKPLGIKHL
jgi:hypothetical protein